MRIWGFCAKIACVIIATSIACETTSRICHVPAALDLVMRNISSAKTRQEWLSGRNLGLRRTKRVSTTFEWNGHILSGQSNTAGPCSKDGEQIVMLNCYFISLTLVYLTSERSRISANMLWHTLASATTQVNKKKLPYKTWSLGKLSQKCVTNCKTFFLSCFLTFTDRSLQIVLQNVIRFLYHDCYHW